MKGVKLDVLESPEDYQQALATSTGDVVSMPATASSGVEGEISDLEVFHSPDTDNFIATNNPDALAAVLAGGIDETPEGNLDFTSVRGKTLTLNTSGEGRDEAIYIYRLLRRGDYFSLETFRGNLGARQVNATESVEPKQISLPKIDSTDRVQSIVESNLGGMILLNGVDLGLGRRTDKLGEGFRDLGFTPLEEGEDKRLPLPHVIQDGIQRLQAEGLDIPSIRFLVDKGSIKAGEFVKSFAEGEFPASGQPDYISHDIGQEHLRPLIVFGGDAMSFAQLYAEAVQAEDTITTLRPIDQYQVNVEDPQLEAVQITGEDKLRLATSILDGYTTEIDALISNIDGDVTELPDVLSEKIPGYWRQTKIMAHTLMNSPYRERFIAMMQGLDSHIIDPQTEEFSFTSFARALVLHAQQRWSIQPVMTHSEPNPIAVEYDMEGD